MEQQKDKNITKRRVAAIITGAVLVIFLSFFLVINYTAQIRLQKTQIAQFIQNLDKQAGSTGYFFSDRKHDLLNLAKAPEIKNFFTNKALGMSMAYGLKASLVQIKKRLESMTVPGKSSKEPLYQRFVFIDTSANLLADIKEEKWEHESIVPWQEFLTPDSIKPAVFAHLHDDHIDLLATIPVFFKGTYKGQIMAWINAGSVFNNLVKNTQEHLTDHICIDFGLDTPDSFYPALDNQFANHIQNIGIKKPLYFTLQDYKKGKIKYLAVKMPVSGTSFFIMAVLPVTRILGSTKPANLLFAMIAFAIFVIGAAVFMWRMNARELVLEIRLEEEQIRKNEMQLKNVQLESEMQVRMQLENTLRKNEANLEDLVKERTKKLEEAQVELVNQAVEAGRAQLSVMVLHNIGNAITPVSVNAEKLKKSSIKDINRYLGQCYDDLAEHKDDLTAYITKDARGIKVADYLGSLIKDLEPRQVNIDATVDKICTGIDYVAEILNLQRAYAHGKSEMKESVNLNLLVEDTLKIQESSTSKREITVKKKLGKGLANLSIEKNKLMQVLVNFIKNSCDAIDEKNKIDGKNKLDETPESLEHEIRVSTFQENGKICLKICDTGSGIEKENQEKIFEFGVSTKGSSGFGLYYCKSFVEANNGTLTIESDGVGQGATIIMEFKT